MEAVFIKLLNMSIAASWLVIAILILRLVLRRVPKAIICVLWAFVAIRLICPVAVESELSLVPSVDTVPEDIMEAEEPKIHSGINMLNSAINPMISGSNDEGAYDGEDVSENAGLSDGNEVSENANSSNDEDVVGNINMSSNASANENSSDTSSGTDEVDKKDNANIIAQIVAVISKLWIVGVVGMALYALASYLRIYKKVREAIEYKENIWLCDRVASPFILGIIRPRIILPSGMAENDMEYVLAHEQAHIKRRDYLWKPLGFVLLAIYWFNPIMWIAYGLLCKDIEMACDEKVIREMGNFDRKAYTTTLLDYSISRRMITACPLAFGESGVSTRIKSVLNYKKPTFWVIIVAVVVCIIVAVTFLTNPKSKETPDTEKETTESGGYYVYPDISGMSYDESIEACRIEKKVLDNMTTEELAQAVVDFPLLWHLVVSSYMPVYESLYLECDAFAELMRREDAKEALKAKVAELEDNAENDMIISIFMDIIYREFDCIEFKANSVVVGHVEDDKFLEDAINKDWLLVSSCLSYPVLKIDSTSQLDAFVEDYVDILPFNVSYNAGEPSLGECIGKYYEGYFEENTLLMVYVGTTVSNNLFYAADVYIDGSNLNIGIASENELNTGDSAMSGYLILVELSKEAVKACTNFNATYTGGTRILTYGYYEYPDMRDIWDFEDSVAACRIEQDILNSMSTEELAQAVVDYPLLTLHYASSQINNTDLIQGYCDAYFEILNRENAKEALIEKVKEREQYDEDDMNVMVLKSIILAEPKFEGTLTDEEREYLE